MKLIRGRRQKPKSDVQVFADTHKERKDEFLHQLNDSRYSLFALKTENGLFLWESNFCGVWIATHPNIEVVIAAIQEHYLNQGKALQNKNA